MLSLRSIWREADHNVAEFVVILAGSFRTEVPQDDASGRIDIATHSRDYRSLRYPYLDTLSCYSRVTPVHAFRFRDPEEDRAPA